MLNPRDARARRTAEALEAALLTLLEVKSLDQITVRELAALAGVNYTTFFRHHPSKEALLDHIASDQINRLVELTLPIFDTENVEAAIAALFTYVEKNRALWKALLTGGAAGVMRSEQLRLSRIVATERAQDESWLPIDLGVNCAVSLIFETLVWWLDQPPNRYSIPQMTDILTRLLGARGLLPKEKGK